MYLFLRSCQGGFGGVSHSVQPSIIATTVSPKRWRMSSRMGLPPWSSILSCNKAAMPAAGYAYASSSLPPISNTSAATLNKWEI
jgi:hypothetical protein